MSSEGELLQRRLLAVEPWAANGPGWANSGLRAIFEDVSHDGKVKTTTEYVYQEKLTAEEALAWQVGMVANAVLRRRFEKMELKP